VKPSTLVAAVVVGVVGVGAGAQTQPPPAPPAPGPAAPGTQPAPQPLPPQLKLGQRVNGLRALAKHGSAVVIVSDAASYLEAISRWRPDARYPVLIDDGTPEAHENIARFVRGYGPAKVVRWKAEGAGEGGAAWPEVAVEDVQKVVARSWGIPKEHASEPLLVQLWDKLKFEPPGVVVMSPRDTAWPAAVALAAARGQLVIGASVPGGVSGMISTADADALEKTIQEGAEASGKAWRGMGDAIETVTLCLNCPSKLDTGKPNEYYALTDRIGRISTGLEDGTRWAWTGQVFGNQQQSAYMAMCSLFIPTRKAWLFDGYPTGEPWSQWDCTKAGGILKDAGVAVEVDDTPRQGAREWKLRSARALSAELVLVNSKGGSNFFDLEPGQCRPGHIPVLDVPSVVHFVHSWSAQFLTARGTVAGRWIERGAFGYYGSVNEPYLQAFLPTPAAAGRLVAGAPFAPAVRTDAAKLWKLAVVGDPLYVLGREQPRFDDLGLEGAVDVSEGLRELLTGGKFTEALRVLTLTGKDQKAAQLALSLLKDRPEGLEPRGVAYAVQAALRSGNNAGVVKLYANLGELAKDPVLQDTLWLAAYPLLEAPEDDVLKVLYDNVRLDQPGADATTLAAAWSRKISRASADAMLESLRKRLNAEQQKDLDEWMKRPFQQWGR